MTQDEIIQKILIERKMQDARYGNAAERGYQLDRWLTILVEEIGEVAIEIQMWPLRPGRAASYEALTRELIQVAAVAVAMIEAQGDGP